MKWLITGGLSGLGKAITQRDPENRTSVSRRSGFDISIVEDRKKIVSLALESDVFVNCAFDGPPHKNWADWGQCRLLIDIVEAWNRDSHHGTVINIGSSGSKTEVGTFSEAEWYRVPKLALDFLSLHYSQEFLSNRSLVRSTLLRPGRLDTPKSRSRSSWTGNGIALDCLVQAIESCAQMHPSHCVEQIDISVNLDFHNSSPGLGSKLI